MSQELHDFNSTTAWGWHGRLQSARGAGSLHLEHAVRRRPLEWHEETEAYNQWNWKCMYLFFCLKNHVRNSKLCIKIWSINFIWNASQSRQFSDPILIWRVIFSGRSIIEPKCASRARIRRRRPGSDTFCSVLRGGRRTHAKGFGVGRARRRRHQDEECQRAGRISILRKICKIIMHLPFIFKSSTKGWRTRKVFNRISWQEKTVRSLLISQIRSIW